MYALQKSDPIKKAAVGCRYIISKFDTTQKERDLHVQHVPKIHDAASDTFKYICMHAGKTQVR